ncbi:hypothetical protein TELCIR_22753, partial [Teladorsagia circumcincta]
KVGSKLQCLEQEGLKYVGKSTLAKESNVANSHTTRPPRDGEIDGEHYRFVSVDEFKRLQTEGLLLEHGTYQ